MKGNSPEKDKHLKMKLPDQMTDKEYMTNAMKRIVGGKLID